MVPFRSSRSSRSQAYAENPHRTRTGQIDHDVFEGLPVRRWARQTQTISQTPKFDIADENGRRRPELPMPRDAHMLPPISRALLRAARAGCKYIQPVARPKEEDGKTVKEGEETGETIPTFERTFTAGKWSQLPRHMEPPEVEFLAKRRAGLPSLYGAQNASNYAVDGSAVQANPPPMRKTKFKKVDPATGNVSVYEAWVPEGHKVEGEITDDAVVAPQSADATVISESPAPGTVVEGVGVVDQQGVVVAEPDASMVAAVTRKRIPPPPKRKLKGFQKGRRKKVMFAPGDGVTPTSAPGTGESPAAATGETAPGPSTGASTMSLDGVSAESEGPQEDEEEEEGEESDEEEESAVETKSPNPSVTAKSTVAEEPALSTVASASAEAAEQGEALSTGDTAHEAAAAAAAALSGVSPSRGDQLSPATEGNQISEPSGGGITSSLPETEQTQSSCDMLPKQPSPEHEPREDLSAPKKENNTVMEAEVPGSAPEPEKEQTPPQTAAPTAETLPALKSASPQPPTRNPEGSDVPATQPESLEPAPQEEQPHTDVPKPAADVTPAQPEPTEPAKPDEPAAQEEKRPSPPARGATQDAVHFDDGEVDLLGSLEASLDAPKSAEQAAEGQNPLATSSEQDQQGVPASEYTPQPAATAETHGESGEPQQGEARDVEMSG